MIKRLSFGPYCHPTPAPQLLFHLFASALTFQVHVEIARVRDLWGGRWVNWLVVLNVITGNEPMHGCRQQSGPQQEAGFR